MTVRVVGRRLECSQCSATRCLDDQQAPGGFDRHQMHFLTRLDAFRLEHLHGAPRPERLTREAVRPHARVSVKLLAGRGAS